MRDFESYTLLPSTKNRVSILERPRQLAPPEVSQNNHTSHRSISTPQRSKRISLHGHYSQQDHQIYRPKDHHISHLREEQRTAGRNHIQHGKHRVIRSIVDVNNAVVFHINVQRIRNQRPKHIKRRSSSKHEKRNHPPPALPIRLKQQHSQRNQKRQQPLRIQHKRRTHLVRHIRGHRPIEPQPHKPLRKLVDRKQRRQRSKQQLTLMFHLRQRRNSNRPQHTASHKVSRSRKAHIPLPRFRFCR